VRRKSTASIATNRYEAASISSKVGPEARRLDETAREHLSDVLQILRMPSLELRERLRVGIDVLEREAAEAIDEWTALTPAAGERDELRRRGELDVDGQLVLDARSSVRSSMVEPSPSTRGGALRSASA
jgi:hypothetical protein